MPERNFEQQARDMANGFEMEPKPAIWQNVRSAIQQPQRKRRFVLWWWLLPLTFIGSMIAFYIVSEQNGKTQIANTTTTQQTKGDKNEIINDQQVNKNKNLKTQTPVINGTTLTITQKRNNASKGHSAANEHAATINGGDSIADAKQTGTKTLYGNVLSDGESGQHTIGEIVTGADTTHSGTIIIGNEGLQQNDAALPAFPPAVGNGENKIPDNRAISADSLQISTSKNSLPSLMLSKDSALSVTASKSGLAGTVKPKKRSALQWGLIAEGGIAARKSSLFSIASLEKSMDARPSPQNLYSLNSGSFGSSSSGFSFSNNIKHGAAVSLGVALQKRMNRSTDVFAAITYDYQSYRISSTAYKDSLLLNYSLTTLIGSYQATQSFYFTSVFAGINWHFINTRKAQFGVSAGIDNLLLLAASQKINSVSNSSFSVERMQGLSDSFFTKTNFYKYQPSLFAGIIVNIKTGKRQWQFVPFTRTSLRPFDKTTTSNNNHLFSAGLRAVYFFK